MKKYDLLDFICCHQLKSGAFKSTVHFPNGDFYEDANAFVTALVLRHARSLSLPKVLPNVFAQAVRFLRTCESKRFPGMYCFWPEKSHPAWIGSFRLYEDADDSSIISLELVRYGIENRIYLEKLALNVLEQHRFFNSRIASDDWRKQGVFLTWLHYKEEPNPVDCCVNTNIIALLAYCGLKNMAGYNEACEMVNNAICNTNGITSALAALSPYYPHAIELFFAVRHAVSVGGDLKPALDYLNNQHWLQTDLNAGIAEDLPICAHQEGTIFWTSKLLQTIRTYELTEEIK